MNKENNRSAAGLRRSAMAERIRLREEWSALKGTADNPTGHKQSASNICFKKGDHFLRPTNSIKSLPVDKCKNRVMKNMQVTSDVLCGVVALVEVGGESRALALRAALMALGATVMPKWSPLVTHLIWSEGGSRATRARARALACRLVSPLWVEACATAAARLPERAFPAAARASDLPSPATLRQMLKRAEMENIPLADLLGDDDSCEEDKEKPQRLRISSETERNTSADTSADTSHDKSADDVRVVPGVRPRRKLFTHKEGEVLARPSDNETDAGGPAGPKRMRSVKLTQRERRDLARAERLARQLAAPALYAHTAHSADATQQKDAKPRIVITGMSRSERRLVCDAIRSLGGVLQKHVNRRSTHVLMGSCREDDPGIPASNVTSVTNANVRNNGDKNTSLGHNRDKNTSLGNNRDINTSVTNSGDKNTSVTNSGDKNTSPMRTNADAVVRLEQCAKSARTVNALLGAARGCRALHAQWVVDSAAAGRWLHHHGYEVPQLRKISQKAHVERTALGRIHTEYAYDVFYGMRVRVTPSADQRDAVIQLLKLCGAAVQDGDPAQNGGVTRNGGATHHDGATQNRGATLNHGATQNGGSLTAEIDLTIGTGEGEVSSKWVFDSVAAARMRTTRRYVNRNEVLSQGS